ncbi:MAG TPA: LD-carboxypeptidase [Acidobacteriaceae bacterium]
MTGLPIRLAVVAPASNADPEKVLRGVERLRALGHTVTLMPHALTQAWPYFAATPEQRLEDLHMAFADPEIDAVICIRGGYGSNYLLEGLDLELLRRNPKPFIGYSDHTAIATWMMDQAGVPVLHGPMVAADFSRGDGVDLLSFAAALGGEAYRLASESGLRALQPGNARGVLYGGCMSLLTASLGTPFAAQTEGKLLFLEDLGEKPYQIDRMLRHMKMAGKLEGVTGIIFGEMLECASPGAPADLLERVILTVLDWFSGPIAYGLRSGHVSRSNVSLPFGAEAELVTSAETAELRIEPRPRIGQEE